MGVRIISDKTGAALYDSTSGFAFGPILEDEWEAEDFLAWLREGSWAENEKARSLVEPNVPGDAREWPVASLALLLRYFREEREGPEPDGQRMEGGTVVPTSR